MFEVAIQTDQLTPEQKQIIDLISGDSLLSNYILKGVEEPRNGAFSHGVVLLLQERSSGRDVRFFVKVPNTPGVTVATEMINAKVPRNNLMKTVAVTATTSNSPTQLNNISHIPPLMDGLWSIQEALPINTTQWLEVLGVQGLRTIQTLERPLTERSLEIASNFEHYVNKIIQALAELHSTQLSFAEAEKRRMSNDARKMVVTDPSRLDGIYSIYCFNDELKTQSLDQPFFEKLRDQMVLLVINQNKSEVDVSKASHGDVWGPNIYIGASDEVSFIDSSTVVADPAMDLAFFTADIAHIAMRMPGEDSNKYLRIADEAVNEYIRITGDKDIRKRMHLYLAYKGFVAAVFDAKTEESRRTLLNWAMGIATKGAEDHEMYFSEFMKIASLGQSQRAS